MTWLTPPIIISILMIFVTYFTLKATQKSAEATEFQVEVAVSPFIYFRMRSLADYEDPNIPYPRKGWVRGVGIYMENLGAGPAMDYKLSFEVIPKEGEPRKYERKFTGSRFLQRMVYTFPSKHWDALKILRSDDKIIINVEYQDRLEIPRSQEPVTLEIEERHFQEYRSIPVILGDVNKLKPEDKFTISIDYNISTTSDWTVFSIGSEERWDFVGAEIKYFFGEDSLKSAPQYFPKDISIIREPAGTNLLLNIKPRMIIPKIKRNQNIKYVIKKGDLGTTIVTIRSGTRVIATLTNNVNTRDPENYLEYAVPIKEHMPLGG